MKIQEWDLDMMLGRVRILTSYVEPIDLAVNLFVAGELFSISVVEERVRNMDGGIPLPPQLSVKLYSSGFDDLSSGVGESVAGIDGRLEDFDDNVVWSNSAARSLQQVNISGDGMASLCLLFETEQCAQMRENVTANLGKSVRLISGSAEVGCGSMENIGVVGDSLMVTGEEECCLSVHVMEVAGVEGHNRVAAVGEPDGSVRVDDTYEGDMRSGSVERVEKGFGSGLKILLEAQQINFFDQPPSGRNLNVGLDEINMGQPFNDGLLPSNVDPATLGLQSLIVADSISSSSSLQPSMHGFSASSSSRPVVATGGKGAGRRGRGPRGGRGACGRGVLVLGGLSTSHRFMHLARGIGRRPRPPLPAVVQPSNSNGIQLHVELPNLNEPIIGDDRGIEVGADEVDGNSEEGSHSGISASRRILTIGRQIGVTFRCGEESMIGKLVQLEERDKREMEERVLRNTDYQ